MGVFDGEPSPPLEDFKPTEDINPDCGDLISVEDYLCSVEFGAFVDYDGFGYPATEHAADPRHCIRPSLGAGCIPPAATHIYWFNR